MADKLQRIRLPLTLLAVLLVVALAWAVRWRAVTTIPVDYDEDDYLRAAQEYAALIRAGDWSGFMQANYRPEHPPLAKIVYGLSILPAPATDLLPDRSTTASPDPFLPLQQKRDARTAAAVFGTLEVALLALVNPLAGLFLAIHTFTIKYTTEIMLEALPAFTSLALVLCYVQGKRKSLGLNGWMVASAVFLGLTASSKYLYCVAGLAVLADWFLHSRRAGELRKFWLQAALWGALAFAIFFVTDPYLWPAPLERLKESVFYHASYASSASEVESAGYLIWQPFVWLMQSVPWHPGVFLVSLDALISLLALIGVMRLWQREPVYILWLVIGLAFLLVWPTKWPQYILILTAPLSLAAAEGVQTLIVAPIEGWWQGRSQPKPVSVEKSFSKRETLRSIPWLLPGLIGLGVLILFPLLFQLAMAFTDFNGASIRDGINGGVWREVWLGLTGQVRTVAWDPFSNFRYSANKVHFAGGNLLGQMFSGSGADLLVFNLIWMVLSVSIQAALGISLAVLLNRRGVRLAGLWRIVFILPWAIPEFIGALIWLRTLQPETGWLSMALPHGADNYFSQNASPGWTMLTLLVASTWYGFPFFMLVASASLKLIPLEVYEAAALDGAHGWVLFHKITWPLLMPLVIPALIIRSIFAFNQFYLFYVMNTNFPMISLAAISYYFFTYGNQYAVSAAINIFTVAVLVGLLIWFNRWSKAAQGVTYA